MRASQYGHKEIAELLLRHGANVNAVDEEGKTASMYAEARDSHEIAELLRSGTIRPDYSSWNGAAMRISPADFESANLNEAKMLARKITEIARSNPEEIKRAEATMLAIYMKRTGSSISEIRDFIDRNYSSMNFTLDDIRATYHFDETCQETVSQELITFFEDMIRNASFISGGSYKLSNICASVLEAYYSIPAEIREQTLTSLDKHLLKILADFEGKYPF